ncbi:hypothetical protein [Kitasatospora nipponensis]
MDDRLSAPGLIAPGSPNSPGAPGSSQPPGELDEPRFPLPKRHRRFLACAAVAASVALGALGVGATVETVQHEGVATAAASR